MSSKDYEARDRDEEQRRKLDKSNYVGKMIRMFIVQDHSCVLCKLYCILFFLSHGNTYQGLRQCSQLRLLPLPANRLECGLTF